MRLEVLYAGDHNLSSFYMAEVARVVASSFKQEIRCDIVYMLTKEGARRFYELSVSLYGEENVKKHKLYAPFPSIFIDGKLAFDQIPPVEELEEAIRKALGAGKG